MRLRHQRGTALSAIAAGLQLLKCSLAHPNVLHRPSENSTALLIAYTAPSGPIAVGVYDSA
jgi:hypothetical protein